MYMHVREISETGILVKILHAGAVEEGPAVQRDQPDRQYAV